MFSGNTSRAVVSKLASVAALATGLLGFVAIAPANATVTPGVYIATGHDLDYHCAGDGGGDSLSCDMLDTFIDKADGSATADILALTSADGSDSCLTQSLDELGVAHHDINITSDAGAAEWAAANLSDYNVIIQGSIWGSGICDEPADDTFITRVNDRSADIIAFYNAGGGIIQQSNGGGEQDNEAWDLNYFMPVGFHAASVEQSDPRSITTAGTSWGLTDEMANCCATHNAFIALPDEFEILETDVNNLPISIVYEGIEMGADGIGGNDLNIDMELDLNPGETVEGAPVTVSGAWLMADSEWNTVLRSTPQTVCSSDELGNTNIYGAFLCTFEIPAGLEPGTHTITLTGLAPDGSTLTRVAYLVIANDGTLVSWSYTDGLAETGVDANEVPAGVLLGGGLALAGAVALVARRRSIAKR